MRTHLLVFALSLLVIGGASCRKHRLRGEGTTVSETRNVGKFAKVDASGSHQITIVKDEEYKVIVNGYSNLVPLFDTRVNGDRLILEYKPGYWNVFNDNITVEVHTPYIDKINLSGSGNVNLGSGFDQEHFEVKLSGSGDVFAGNNKYKRIEVDVNGSGNVNVENCISDDVYAKISGSGNIYVYANSYLNVKISGSGDVYYKGNPGSTDIDISGSGKVKKRN